MAAGLSRICSISIGVSPNPDDVRSIWPRLPFTAGVVAYCMQSRLEIRVQPLGACHDLRAPWNAHAKASAIRRAAGSLNS